MYPELTNLLPLSKIQAFRRMYFLRLITLSILMGVLLIVVHSLLLIPSYLYARGQVTLEEKELAGINAALESSQEKEVKARVKSLQDTITYLDRLGSLPSASSAIRAVVLLPRPGIALTGFTFTPSKTIGGPSTLVLAGTASSRVSLENYVQTLSALPYVSSADLPISAYAEVKDIKFIITVTGSLNPTP